MIGAKLGLVAFYLHLYKTLKNLFKRVGSQKNLFQRVGSLDERIQINMQSVRKKLYVLHVLLLEIIGQ